MKNVRAFWLGAAIFGFALCIAYMSIGKGKDELSADQTAIITEPILVTTKLSNASGDEAKKQNSDDIALLKQQIAVLGVQLTQLRSELNAIKHNNGNLIQPNQMQTPDEFKKSLDPGTRTESDYAYREEMRHVEAAFNNEPRDSRWAADLNSQISNALDNNQVLQQNLRNIECRSKTCRIEFSNETVNGMQQTLLPLLAQLAPAIPSVSTGKIDQTSDASKTVLYLSASQER